MSTDLLSPLPTPTDEAAQGYAAYTVQGEKFGSTVFGTYSGTVTWSYALNNYGGQHSFDASGTTIQQSYDSEIQRAFELWSSVANIDFAQVTDSSASGIRIGVDIIDGRSNTLAICYFSGNGSSRDAQIAFDRSDLGSTASFFDTAVHEIGHALGLNHEDDTLAIMNSYSSSSNIRGLLADDIAGIRQIYGSRNDWINGGSFSGTASGERIEGTSRNDLEYGREGNDTLNGGVGDDRLYGQAGNDVHDGDDGIDYMDGGLGNDTLNGGNHDDALGGGSGADVINGDAGSDYLLAGTEADAVNGGSGDDFLRGQQDSDTISGGDGNDRIWGDRGTDLLIGGNGADWFATFNGAGVSTVQDFSFAGGDRIALEAGMSASVSAGTGRAILDFGGGTQIILLNVAAASITQDWFVTI